VLLAKVDRLANRLYVLELNIARPVCFAMQGTSAADGNKSLYLVFVGVVFLSILDCF
jgi:hypothetical protein